MINQLVSFLRACLSCVKKSLKAEYSSYIELYSFLPFTKVCQSKKLETRYIINVHTNRFITPNILVPYPISNFVFVKLTIPDRKLSTTFVGTKRRYLQSNRLYWVFDQYRSQDPLLDKFEGRYDECSLILNKSNLRICICCHF